MNRGTSNSNVRGNTRDRARRRDWIREQFGINGFVPCHWCGKKMRTGFEIDRLVCGHAGGRYVRSNIVPACPDCNKTRCSVKGCRFRVSQ